MIAKEILTQDVTYKQKQNSRYKEQVGAKNTFDVIEGFGASFCNNQCCSQCFFNLS